jgi:hypothetical protein
MVSEETYSQAESAGRQYAEAVVETMVSVGVRNIHVDSSAFSPLSGQWAGDPVPSDILRSLDVADDNESAPDVIDAYESAYLDELNMELNRRGIRIVTDDDDEEATDDDE